MSLRLTMNSKFPKCMDWLHFLFRLTRLKNLLPGLHYTFMSRLFSSCLLFFFSGSTLWDILLKCTASWAFAHMPFLNFRLSLTDGIYSYGSTYKLSLLTSQIQTFNPDLSANFMLMYATFYSTLILCVTIDVQFNLSKMDFIFFIVIWLFLSYWTTSSLYCTK